MADMSTALVAQQAVVQQKVAVSMLRQAAESQQAVVNMITETVAPSGRGKIVDIAA